VSATKARGVGEDAFQLLQQRRDRRTAPLLVSGQREASTLVPLAQITFDPRNSPDRLHGPDVDEMALSMADGIGIIDAITVADADAYLAAYPEQRDAIGAARYVALDGNRRLAAGRKAQLDSAPVHVRNDLVGEGRDSRVRVIANTHRRDLSPIEEAAEYRRLQTLGHSVREIAAGVACAHSNVVKKLSLLQLPAAIQDAITRRQLPVIEALTLLDLAGPDEQLLAFGLIRGGKKAKAAVGEVIGRRPRPGADGVDAGLAREDAFTRRDAVCASLVETCDPDAASTSRLVARYAARGGGSHVAASRLAHRWLRGAGVGPAIDDPTTYLRAVEDEEVVRAAFAVALAAEELHARQAEGWDARSAEQLERLTSGGYRRSAWDEEKSWKG
jgi:ParB/RepB/Spo0J family partition protein